MCWESMLNPHNIEEVGGKGGTETDAGGVTSTIFVIIVKLAALRMPELSEKVNFCIFSW
jgi:hypothetical protein